MGLIAKTLSGGDAKSLGETENVVAKVLQNQALFNELFNCLWHGDAVVRMRAGDAIEKICRRNPDWLTPYKEQLLKDVPKIRQASVQWHLAQIFGEIELDRHERQRAAAIMLDNLATMDDWIVANLTMQTLYGFVRDGTLDKAKFTQVLSELLKSKHKSVAKRAAKLLSELS